MRTFKPTYKSKEGKTKKVNKWWISLRDHQDVVRKFPGYKYKSETEKLGEKIEKLVVSKKNAEPPGRELSQWLNAIPPKLRDRFAKIGLLDTARLAGAEPLSQHLADFRASLERGRTAKHVEITCSRIRRIFEGCGSKLWNDIEGSVVTQYLNSLDVSDKTYNQYLTALKQFCKWMIAERRASASPVAHLNHLRVQHIEFRRALTSEEVRRLLTTTVKAPTRFGMTGIERAVLYLLAVETGLRVREIQSLTVSSFDFEDVTVTARGESCKNRKTAVQLLKKKRAAQLKDFFAGKTPDDKAFDMPTNSYTAPMLKADLAETGIEYVDDQGRKADFHCLRHSLATALDETGASLAERMAIMRHSCKSSNLTLGIYTHVQTHNLRRAVENLPDYPWPGTEQPEALAATGTDDANVTVRNLAENLASLHAKQCSTMKSGGNLTLHNKSESPF